MSMVVLTWIMRLRRPILWTARTAADREARRRFAGLGLLALAGGWWLLLCGGLLAGLALFGAGPSRLGLALFLAVPAALAVVAEGAIVRRLRRPAAVTEAALPVVALWFAVSAVVAYAACFALT
jgi:hypothetical protein